MTQHESTHLISAEHLSIEQIKQIVHSGINLSLSLDAQQRISTCRAYLEAKIADESALHYGINTGFGSLCNVRISPADLQQLQHNLVMSHAAGTGDSVPTEVVQIMLLLKIQSLAYGYSGVTLGLIERLIDLYNAKIWPVIYELGSLGASGDLAPLAHLSLPLIGMGNVWHHGQQRPAAEVLAEKGWSPLQFQAKEALALLNGTQFSTAYGVWCLIQAGHLADWADGCAAAGYDAFNCRLSPLHALLHHIRPHKGQVQTAARLLQLLDDSELALLEKDSVQDPYAFRCVPQVHGATRDTLRHVREVIEVEVNAVTDNPNVFPDDDLILSGGNFHAQPIALALDFLCIALAELGSISERRVYQLISGQRGLPPFLTRNPGLHSGLMIAQYTAAAIVNQNKTYCTPASADSIVSCNGQEDHVSMAANAATKCRRVVLNVERLLAIEWLCATQALEFRRPHLSSPTIERHYQAFRQRVPALEQDRIISADMDAAINFLRHQPF
jgi:histidine ammonia-lyase